MKFVIIMTDTQPKFMVGAYGNPSVETPNLDKLADEGIRFDRAYTSCPLCTPARASVFTGLHPQIAGAWCNNIAPGRHVAMMGEIFRHHGYRAAYTGKWHLDGSSYFGDGEPGGGFEPEWWYDGKRYAEEIGPEMFAQYRANGGGDTPDEARANGFTENMLWGTRVADRAIDFLQKVNAEENFVLACSFDEPHGPCACPAEDWEAFLSTDKIPPRPTLNAPLEGKPELQKIFRSEIGDFNWEDPEHRKGVAKFAGCNRFIDRQIGRVVDTVSRLHGEDTIIIYVTDHGCMFGAHGLREKGPMMYEEITHIPFIVKMPGGSSSAVSNSLVSLVDIIPTILDYSGEEIPEVLNGVSLRPVLEDPSATLRERTLISFNRFAINHDSYGGFFPIRCATDGRYKLAVNLLDPVDELYDLETDPGETRNLIDDPETSSIRDDLHDWLISEMGRIRDPFRGWPWGNRPWRKAVKPFYSGGVNRHRPAGFKFQPSDKIQGERR
jgi:uncharacterized sulfatase